MAPFDRSHTSSYSPIRLHARYRLQRLIGRKSRNFYTPSVFSAPAGVRRRSNFVKMLTLVKLQWLGYHMVIKLWQYVKPFSYNTSVSRTDGRTDGRTDRRTDRIAISISCVSVLTRDKNVLSWRRKLSMTFSEIIGSLDCLWGVRGRRTSNREAVVAWNNDHDVWTIADFERQTAATADRRLMCRTRSVVVSL